MDDLFHTHNTPEDRFQKFTEHIFIERLLCTPDTDPNAGGTDTAEDETKSPALTELLELTFL